MRDISLSAPTTPTLPIYSWLIHGDSRAGKTFFAATLPRPLIIADVAESGYKTILAMGRDLWFEPAVEPMIIGIDQMNDISTLAGPGGKIDQLISSKRVMSIVFDAFSFYCDFFLAQLFKLQAADKQDNRRAYGDLGKHLREVRTIIGGKGVNVAYLCLSKHPDEDDPNGRPMIPGQQSDKFSAGVDFIWHARLNQKIEQAKIVEEIHELRTRKFRNYLAGHRLGSQASVLPDPFVGTYADFLTIMGYDVEAIRASMPKIIGAPVARPVVAARSIAPRVSSPPASRVVSPPTATNPAQRGAKP